MPDVCPTCGQPWQWVCKRCGSTDRRPGGKGCAECARRYQRNKKVPRASRRPPGDDSDIELTPAMRAYLGAFDAWLLARRVGDSAAARVAADARARLLARIEDS